MDLNTPAPDLVVTLDCDDARTVELLGYLALPLDSPTLRQEIIGKKMVALVNKDAIAGTCFELGVAEVLLLQFSPDYRSLRDYLGLGPTPELQRDLDEPIRSRWLDLLNRAHLLHPDDYPQAIDVSTTTGLPEHSAVPFPVHCLPVAMHDLAVEGAAAQGVDPAMWGVPLLGALAGAIGNAFALQVKSTWTVKPILWMVTVCPSGAGKSPPLDLLFSPHRDRDRHLVELANEQLQAYLAAVEAAKRDKRDRPDGPPPRRAALVTFPRMRGHGV